VYRKLSAPVAIQWEVTPSCNHLCEWCYNFWRKESPLPLLPNNYEIVFQKVVDELIKNKVFSVVITGGEPMMVIKQIAPYIKQLSDANIQIYLNSNLTLLTSEKASLLQEIGIKSILVSLPTADSETCDRITNSRNVVARTTLGIKIAQDHGFPIMVNMVVSRDNLHQIRMTARHVASLGVKSFAATRASNPVPKSDFVQKVLSVGEFRQMLTVLDEVANEFNFRTDTIEANPPCAFGEDHIERSHRFCSAGRNSCTIGYEGNIRPCNRLPMVYGNILSGLTNAWLKMDDCRSDEWIPIECEECKMKLRCRGGCKADALVQYGDLKKPDPLCDFEFMPEPKSQNIQPTTDNLFVANFELKLRREDFGGIAYVGNSSWIAINHKMFELLSSKKKIIKLKEAKKILFTNINSARLTMAFLIKNKILIPKNLVKGDSDD